jgi:iron complex transport system ATP-binding protein
LSCLCLHEISVDVAARRIVDDVSFGVDAGEWVTILGPNGAGKTTLLKTVAGLQRFQGELRVAGLPAGPLSTRRLARLVALVPQQPVIPEELTVAEYVLLGRTPHLGYFDQESDADTAIVEEVLAQVDLGPLAGRRLASLSGGELQRAVIARALAQQPSLLLLDEPTASLDVGRQRDVLDLIDELRRENGLTVLATFHDLSLAAQYGDRLLLLSDGRLVASGVAADVLSVAQMQALYGTAVRIVHDDGRLVGVVPLRGGRCGH